APTHQADADDRQARPRTPLTLAQILRIRGAKAVMLTFFCYCAIEATAGLWAASYLNLHRGVSAEDAASYAAAFFVGLTVGRALSGFLTIRFSDDQMIIGGEALIVIGIATTVSPGHNIIALMGLVVIGLGCAPVYPSIIHATPARFGADKSQAIIGVQMATAYAGTLAMPPFFGLIANHFSVALFPYYLMLLLFAMAASHRLLLWISATHADEDTA
ncbi:MAG: MFS transporter, partial [Actinomycetaceae bacterium UMB1218B]|nr:MFS transporter [Actinomycetaceae bacterium UMB1218B]